MNKYFSLFLLALSSSFVSADPINDIWHVEGGKAVFDVTEHTLNRYEQAYAMTMAALPEQLRDRVILDPVMCAYARGIAEDQINRGFSSHINPDGQHNKNYLSVYTGELLSEDDHVVVEPFDPFTGWNVEPNYYDTCWLDAVIVGDLMGNTVQYNVVEFLDSTGGHAEALKGEVGKTGIDTSDYIYIGIGSIDHAYDRTVEDPYLGNTRSAEKYNRLVILYSNRSFRDYTEMELFTVEGVRVTDSMDWKAIGKAADIMDRAGDPALRGDYYNRGGSTTVFDTTEYNPAGLRPFTRNTDGSLQSPWLGRFVDVGGGYILSEALGLVYSHPDNGNMLTFPELQLTAIPMDTSESIYPVTVHGTYLYKYPHWSANQGYHFYTPEKGWFWMHPRFGRNARLRDGSWVPAREIKGNTANTAKLSVSTRQAFVGDTVVAAWFSTQTSPVVEVSDGQRYEQSIGATAITLTQAGTYTVTLTSQSGAPVEQTVTVLPAPANPVVSITATRATGEANSDLIDVEFGEVFTISWNANATPIIESNDIGIWSNQANGSMQFAKAVPGVYSFTIRVGAASKTVLVRVKGDIMPH